MRDLVLDVSALQLRTHPIVGNETRAGILRYGEHFLAVEFRQMADGKTRVVWARNSEGLWAMVIRGRSLYFKYNKKPFDYFG